MEREHRIIGQREDLLLKPIAWILNHIFRLRPAFISLDARLRIADGS